MYVCASTYVHTYDVLYRMHCVYLCMRMYVRDFVHIKAESVQTYVRVCCTVHAYVRTCIVLITFVHMYVRTYVHYWMLYVCTDTLCSIGFKDKAWVNNGYRTVNLSVHPLIHTQGRYKYVHM